MPWTQGTVTPAQQSGKEKTDHGSLRGVLLQLGISFPGPCPHKRALKEIPEPLHRQFRGPLQRLEVDMVEPQPQCVPRSPLKAIE
jgi:hypothetical protein